MDHMDHPPASLRSVIFQPSAYNAASGGVAVTGTVALLDLSIHRLDLSQDGAKLIVDVSAVDPASYAAQGGLAEGQIVVVAGAVRKRQRRTFLAATSLRVVRGEGGGESNSVDDACGEAGEEGARAGNGDGAANAGASVGGVGGVGGVVGGCQDQRREHRTSMSHPLDPCYCDLLGLGLPPGARLGICMLPGRRKRKKAWVWDRSLEDDLQRLTRDDDNATAAAAADATGAASAASAASADDAGAAGADGATVHRRINVLVTMTPDAEIARDGSPGYFDAVRAAGLESIHWPMRDKWVPHNAAAFYVLVASVVGRLRNGARVVVHCNGGKGRSATVMAAVLIALRRHAAITEVQALSSGLLRNPLQVSVPAYLFTTSALHHIQKR